VTLTRANIDALNALATDHETTALLRRGLPAWRFEQIVQAEYTAYLCTLCDHDCQCLALSFDEWRATL